MTLAAGESALIRLDGNGAQLSNGGGTLVLRDPNGIPVDAATFTAAEASVENLYVRLSSSRVRAL